MPRFFDGKSERGELHFGKGQEDVLFTGKIVEEGSFAHVGGVGDVFHGGLGKALLGKEVEGGAENAFAKLNAAPFAAVGGRRNRGRGHNDLNSLVTIGHLPTNVNSKSLAN